ncbi:RIP metalloprotease RseP [Gemmatimonas aurantiaca]|uniref:RIP metalloprotease RseP n=1 Tax=Gemmatimonas aurantiaca TaxID=173480 RepID=UPI00301BF5A6
MASLSVYIAPLLVFGLVVFVHELGHFMAAKMTGVYAPVFSLGWGRRLFGWRRGETDYRVSMFPLGGYVRMASRDDEALAGIEGASGDRGSLDGAAQRPAEVPEGLWDPQGMAPFGPKAVPANRWVENKSTAARVFILSAGVLMNILLTIVVSSGIYYRYGNQYLPAVIDSVVPGAPAAVAGLQAGDRIVAINGESVRSWDQVLDRVAPVTTGTVTLEVQRGAEALRRELTPQVGESPDPVTGAPRKVGRVGIKVRDSVVREPVALGTALTSGTRATWKMAREVVQVLGGLISGEVSAKNLGGPIQIARTSVQAARNGAETLWSLIAFLSLNIAILNLVPIPVLDGGQILMVLAERVKGSEFSMRTREAVARVGVLAVLALILLVTFNDVRSFFTR